MSVGGTEVETGLPFGHEMDSGTSFWGIGDDVRFDRGSAKLTLLRTTPLVGMGQHELNAARDGVPAAFTVLIGGDEESFG